MYEGPITYETQVYDYFLMLLLAGLVALVIVFFLISLGKIFKKADKNPLLAFIPFYNILILLQIIYLPNYYLLLLFIPIINLYPLIKIPSELGRTFRKNKGFIAGLFFLPVIYYPLLAFRENRYVGMNEEKVNSIVLEELIEEEKGPVMEEKSILMPSTESKEESPSNSSFIKEEKESSPIEVKMPEFKKPVEPEYKECPKCRNKVRSEATTCFICGHHFEG